MASDTAAWAPQEAKPEAKAWWLVFYLEGDSENKREEWGREGKSEGMLIQDVFLRSGARFFKGLLGWSIFPLAPGPPG